VKTFFLLSILIITQVLGDISLSRGMKTFGTVNPFDLPSLMPLAIFLVTNVWIWLAIFFLVTSLGFYLVAVSRLDLSYVLPIHAFSYVVNAIFAGWLLQEVITPMRWFSTSMISLGVLFVGLSKNLAKPAEVKSPQSPIKPRNLPFFLFPLSLSVSKTWLAVMILSCADSAGDLFLAQGMKKIGSVNLAKLSHLGKLILEVFTSPSILSGITCQAIAFISFISVLSWADISFVRPATALTYLFSMLGARFILKEHFVRERLVGITLIGLGVTIHQ